MAEKLTLKWLEEQEGTELGLSEWVEVSQDRINAFAECTEDRQWIHVDMEKAKKSPLRTTVAHGFLLLSLLPYFNFQYKIFQRRSRMVLNYGLDKVRFINPVRSGARIRNRAILQEVVPQGARKVLIRIENSIEVENEEKPAVVVEGLVLIYL